MGLENKVRVTKLYGGGGALGVMSPKLNMTTDQGRITALDTGDLTVSVSGDSVGLVKKMYPHQLLVLESHATSTWSWPTGDGSHRFTRGVVFPSGVPDIAESGMFYKKGVDGGVDVQSFSRP